MSQSRFSIEFLLNGEDKDPDYSNFSSINANTTSPAPTNPNREASHGGIVLATPTKISGISSSANLTAEQNLLKQQQFLDHHYIQMQEYQRQWQQINQYRANSELSLSQNSAFSLPSSASQALLNRVAPNPSKIANFGINNLNSTHHQLQSSTDQHFSNPLDYLAHASFSRNLIDSKDQVNGGAGVIKIVEGPSGPTVQLHNEGVGTLPSTLSKLASMKCKNRECNNLCGQLNKPRSIYCSKRCQSREQNLRQGRIKNLKKNPSNNISGSSSSSSIKPSITAANIGSAKNAISMPQQRSIVLQLEQAEALLGHNYSSVSSSSLHNPVTPPMVISPQTPASSPQNSPSSPNNFHHIHNHSEEDVPSNQLFIAEEIRT